MAPSVAATTYIGTVLMTAMVVAGHERSAVDLPGATWASARLLVPGGLISRALLS